MIGASRMNNSVGLPGLPWLKPFDIMNLHSATSAIMSAVIFNAIIIPLLIPIALKGVQYQPVSKTEAYVPDPNGVVGPTRRKSSVPMGGVGCSSTPGGGT